MGYGRGECHNNARGLVAFEGTLLIESAQLVEINGRGHSAR